ncbi:MAG: BspA family leucine-rich repeat surface protein [Bacteroidota bacterium]
MNTSEFTVSETQCIGLGWAKKAQPNFLKLAFITTLFLSMQMTTKAQDAFITEWDIFVTDTSSNTISLTIPLQSGTYNFDYSWRLQFDTFAIISGTHTNADGDFTTTFPFPGTYRLEITGEFPHLRGYPANQLLDVIQWGDIEWRDFGNMFQGWPGVSFSATDAPDLSQVANMRQLFLSARNFDDDLDDWNTSNVTNMAQVFEQATNFNGNITTWDVSDVTFFFRMFKDTEKFNQNISSWDMSSANNVERMFDNADDFNQPIGEWDVSNVTKFRRMLASMSDFNQPLGKWKFRSNADFSQFTSGTNGVSCENWSSTILGWNFSNPTLQNLQINGFNEDYDAVASRARDELVARGWNILGTDIGGDCGAFHEFRRQDVLTLSNDTLFGDLLIAGGTVTLDAIVIDAPGLTNCLAEESITLGVGFHALSGSQFTARIGALECTAPDTIFPEQITTIDHPVKEAITPPTIEARTQVSLPTLDFTVAPNPFYDHTQLCFQLPESQMISLRLFDQRGRLIRTIIPTQEYAAGEYNFQLRNEQGLSGLYFLVLRTENEQMVWKVMVSQ